MMQRIPVTVLGSKLLNDELEQLERIERPKIINAIAEARAHGDLRENAEYHAAREQQSFIEGRIADLKAKIDLAEVIDVQKLPRVGKVVFGVTVEILNVDTDAHMRYHIVGEDEADIKQGKISVTSPIARALIGKEEGDVADVQTPSGVQQLEIVKVLYE
jgi:transcription elongation factor GreA